MLFAEIPAGCDQTIAKLCLKPRFIDNQNEYKIIQARFTALVALISAQGDKVAVEIDFRLIIDFYIWLRDVVDRAELRDP